MNSVDWFEIPVTDLVRSIRNGYVSHERGLRAAGGLIKGEGYIPSHTGTLVYFGISDLEATLERVRNKGGKVLLPKTSIGQYGFIAHFEDTEGNKLALHSPKA